MAKEAKIFSVVMIEEQGQYLVTLEELNGTRLLPIWIGPAEGIAIAAGLQNHFFPRPMTHDLISNIIKGLGIKVEKVTITDLKNDTFYALITLRSGEKLQDIDARPSDSIAIALRCKCPVYIEDRVFDKCPRIDKPITEEEARRFKKQLENLKPEDFFRGPSNG